METEYVKIYVGAGAVISRDGKYLLVQERKPSAFGLWNWPGGRVERGDTIEDTAVKEAKEETGYDVEVTKKIGFFHEKLETAVQHLFAAKIVGGDLKIPEEMIDVKWFSEEEIRSMKDSLRFEWVLGGLDLINKG